MSDAQTQHPGYTSPFDAIRHTTPDGGEYWSARDLAKLLGYKERHNFTTAIEKAKEACKQSRQATSYHSVGFNKMIATGKRAHHTDAAHITLTNC